MGVVSFVSLLMQSRQLPKQLSAVLLQLLARWMHSKVQITNKKTENKVTDLSKRQHRLTKFIKKYNSMAMYTIKNIADTCEVAYAGIITSG